MNDSGVHGMHESTPNLPLNFAKTRLKSILPSPIAPLRCSTLNDSSLADGVEQLHLKFTPSLPPPQQLSSATTTASTATTSPAEFIKNHHESLKKTPIKSGACTKLGSPERNELISGRRPTAARWSITPRVERASPAKKRLFGGVSKEQGVSLARRSSPLAVLRKFDPVSVFMHKQNLPHVVRKIFGQLQDKDLYNCRRVSATWRAAVDSYPTLKKSALDFGRRVELNKENPSSLQRWLYGDGVENQPKNVVKDKFIQLGQKLKENLHLRKCPRCQNPQIIEYNIGQCQDPDCGYICCLKCNSYTLDGAETFVDRCNSGAFDISGAGKRRTLMDSPPQSQFAFFDASTPPCAGGDAADISHLYANVSKDSCYYSYEEAASARLSDSSANLLSASLSVSNGQREGKRRSLDHLERSTKRSSLEAPPPAPVFAAPLEVVKRPARSLYTPVRPICKSPGKPSEDSPVKDYSAYKGAGTTASKKRLKRLLR